MSNKKTKQVKIKKESHIGRNITLVVFLSFVSILVVLFIFNFLNNDNKDYLSDEEWYDGIPEWTTHTEGDLSVYIPKSEAIVEDYDYYDEFNESDLPGLGGCIIIAPVLENSDDEDSAIDSIRIFICLYASLDGTDYTSEDLHDLISERLYLDDPWIEHSYSDEKWKIDDHGKKEIIVKEASDDEYIGMYAYCTYYCINTGRTYAILYSVIKNSTINNWSDNNFKRESKLVLEKFVCHT